MHAHRILASLSLCLATLLPAGRAFAGGPIVSGERYPGTIAGPSYLESWTFTATAGDRVLIVAVTQTGAVNTLLELRAPGGALLANTTADRLDLQLPSTGTYSLDVSDVFLNDAGTYALALLNVTAGPLTSAGDPDGGPIASAEHATGGIQAAADLDAFTFTGSAGDRVLFGCLATAGAGFNTNMTLYPPGGGSFEFSGNGTDRLDHALLASGTYTLVIEDVGDDLAGDYAFSLLNLAGPLTTPADPDGGTIASGEIVTGGNGVLGDFDAFRFTGVMGQRVLFASVESGGASYNTQLYLYPPSGTPIVSTIANRTDVQLTMSGTWTVVIQDNALDHTGTYTLGIMNVTGGPLSTVADPDGGTIASGEHDTGQMSGSADFDAFTFSGTAGHRVLFSCLTTGGAMNSSMTLYPPGGGAAEYIATGNDRLDHALLATGTYTLVVEDVGNDQGGSYAVSFLDLSGPLTTVADPDGGPIASGEILSGATNMLGDFDAFRFSGVMGQRVLLAALATGGAGYNPQCYLYPPSGTPTVVTLADRFDTQLTMSGTWTLVVQDVALSLTGTYRIALLNVTGGPHTTVADPDGAPIASAGHATGQNQESADFDAFTFTGTAGDRVLISCVSTAGTPPYNTSIALFPPGGGPAENNTTGGDRMDHALLSSGTYTIVVEDTGNDHPGSYALSLLNLAGPLSSGGDPDGGFLASDQARSGTTNVVGDFDAFQFSGQAGARVLLSVLETSAVPYQTQTWLYPPGGGTPVLNSFASRHDLQLPVTGTYTVVVHDVALDNSGTYQVSYFNVTHGPHNFAPDGDSAPIASGERRAGQMQALGDFDAFTFLGGGGDRVLIGAIATGGASYNSTVTLYPPGGGPAEFSATGADRSDRRLLQAGMYTIVVEDLGNDHVGDYAITYLNVTGGNFAGGVDPDGGVVEDGDVVLATCGPAPDFDAWRFGGTAGDQATISAVVTAGAMNTMTYLYPPDGGGPAVFNSVVDVTNHALTQTGAYVIVIQDVGLTATGDYTLSFNKTGGIVGVEGGAVEGPLDATHAVLQPARPLPFTRATTLTFSLPREQAARLVVYDVSGARVRVLADGVQPAGVHRVAWDGRDERGGEAAAGVYFARLEANGEARTTRLVRIP